MSLSPGGCFVNADFVDSGSRFYSRVFDGLRVTFMRERGLSDDEIRRRYTEHRELEIPVPMDVQLGWLNEIGFSDVECFWKYLNLAVFGGRKPGLRTSEADHELPDSGACGGLAWSP